MAEWILVFEFPNIIERSFSIHAFSVTEPAHVPTARESGIEVSRHRFQIERPNAAASPGLTMDWTDPAAVFITDMRRPSPAAVAKSQSGSLLLDFAQSAVAASHRLKLVSIGESPDSMQPFNMDNWQKKKKIFWLEIVEVQP